MRGKLRPPSLWERYRGATIADLATPDHFSRKSVASASAFFSTHDMGSSSIVRSRERHGHTPNLYKRSFCFLVRGHVSILWSIRFNSMMIMDFDVLWSCGISTTLIHRNFTGCSAKGIDAPPSVSPGFIFFPVEACSPKLVHLGIFVFIPDQVSHSFTMPSRC